MTLQHAELSSITSHNHERTVQNYLSAIALAELSGNLFEGALAHEWYSRYLRKHGDGQGSLTHLRIAISLYQEWNAYRKVDILRNEIENVVVNQ